MRSGVALRRRCKSAQAAGSCTPAWQLVCLDSASQGARVPLTEYLRCAQLGRFTAVSHSCFPGPIKVGCSTSQYSPSRLVRYRRRLHLLADVLNHNVALGELHAPF